MDTSIEIRSKILTLSDHTSKSTREIAKIVGRNPFTVVRIINHAKKHGQIETMRNGKCGRKTKTTEREERKLVITSKKFPKKTSGELLQDVGLNVSTRTVNRILKRRGRIARRPIKKQLLNKKMKKSAFNGQELTSKCR